MGQLHAAVTAHRHQGVEAQLVEVEDDAVRDVFKMRPPRGGLDHWIVKGVTPIGGPENGAPVCDDSGHAFGEEEGDAARVDEPGVATVNSQDLPAAPVRCRRHGVDGSIQYW